MIKLVVFILSPFFMVLLFRGIMPLSYLSTSQDLILQKAALYQSVAFALVISITCICAFGLLSHKKNKITLGIGLPPKKSENKTIAYIGIIGTAFVYIITGENTPLFSSAGSDAAMHAYGNPGTKNIAYLSEVISLGLVFFLLPYATIGKAGPRLKFFLCICCIFLAAHGGKKTALLLFFGYYVLLLYLNPREALGNVYRVSMGGVLAASGFFVYQFQRTASHYGFIYGGLELIPVTASMVYGSSTALYHQMFFENGVELAESYSRSLGDFPALTYWLNPFTKFFLGYGIEYSIGPFLSLNLYDNSNPNGVNPTLPFEMYFVFGSPMAGWIGVFVAAIIAYFFILSLMKLISSAAKQYVHSTSMCLFAVWFFLAALFDSLYAIRMAPAFVLIYSLIIIAKSHGKLHRMKLFLLRPMKKYRGRDEREFNV